MIVEFFLPYIIQDIFLRNKNRKIILHVTKKLKPSCIFENTYCKGKI